MQDFDVFESLKRETDLSLIAEIKVMDGEAILVRNELNLFSKPFLSCRLCHGQKITAQPRQCDHHGNGSIRVHYPFNRSSIKDTKIRSMKVVFFARTFVICTSLSTVGTDTGNSWYTHPIFRELGDDLGVKLYG